MNAQAYHKAKFLLSAARLNQLPSDTGREVAFVGRSNAGKSSALNCLTQQKKLARTSKTPGCTQLINIFELDAQHRLIDLPGYGYAKVPLATKQKWQQLLADYLAQRHCLRGLILLMDIRHPLTEIDQMMLDWSIVNQLPVHILLTKADKLKRGASLNVLRKLQQTLSTQPLISLQLFSSTKKTGLSEAYAVLDNWLFLDHSTYA